MGRQVRNQPPPDAHELAKKQREISVSEFFIRNRHLLGFDNPKRALLTAVKEAVDNALDACEEARILPEILVCIEPVQEQGERYRLTVLDNGPGIVRAQIPKIFGKLLYGSKFHRLKMARGQQGIGISAAAMYGQLTTGKPTRITSKFSPTRKAHYFEINIETHTNNPIVVKEEERDWEHRQGTQVEIELEGKNTHGRQSVEEYLLLTAVANPHATFRYTGPEGERMEIPRATDTLPEEPQEIKPHPHGIELGALAKMLQTTKSRRLSSFLHSDFSRVSTRVALAICESAGLEPAARPGRIARTEADRLYQAINTTKLMNPPTSCISPIGEDLLIRGLKQRYRGDFFTACTRPPAVYRGNPFLIEAAVAYGGENDPEGQVQVMRFANRVPLLYQQGACAISQAISEVDWKAYRLQQGRGQFPQGPMVLMVHFASVWVPFTSESKEAIAHYPIILKELKLALQECGRRLSSHVRGREIADLQTRRRNLFELYIHELSQSLSHLTGKEREAIREKLLKMARKATRAQDARDRAEQEELAQVEQQFKLSAQGAVEEGETLVAGR
ncbi:MAG: DNA topoisomerase VI subunit B [Planctomycetes bacterium]|nr:DNA topoisomerase VI subunit B [Planctomycetota bacterium]